MPVKKSQQACVNRYIARHYDRVNLTLPAGQLATIQAAAAVSGQSVNAYIRDAIEARIKADGFKPNE